jgi:hypothetical protein
MIDESSIRLRFEALKPVLDEHGRRRFAAAEVQAAGFGGIEAVARITGIARSTIGRGLAELRGSITPPPPGRVRRPGAGRKPLTETDPSLLDDLRGLVEPATRGDPQRALLWTAKSLRNLADGLRALGHRVSYTRWAVCWPCSATACKPTARPAKGPAIPTATLSSATSTSK